MFKLSRNNAGDAKDVAALRAAVFDELTGLWNKSAAEIAKDSLKLGGKEAALYALLTDLDTLKSTYFSGTSAKTALKLATARKINGVSFDGTADIELPVAASSAGFLGAYTGTTPTNYIISNAPNGKSLLFVQYNSQGSTAQYPANNSLATSWFYHIERYGDYITVKAKSANVLTYFYEFEWRYNNPNSSGWKQLFDTSGAVINAKHQADPQTINGTVTRGSIYSALITTFGTGAWTVGINGGYYASVHIPVAYAVHADGASTISIYGGGSYLSVSSGDSATILVSLSF